MPPRATPAAGATHVGNVRDNNEDFYTVTDGIWAVADGLGGHAGGEVASELAVTAAIERLAAGGFAEPEDALPAAYRAAHRVILDAAAAEPAIADMGTTLVLAWRDDEGRIRIGNVGDSRAYLLTDGGLDLVTIDDNYAHELYEAGQLTAEQARVHPGRFLLSRALGLDDADGPQPRQHVLASPGRLLLCSDGLNSELPDDHIGTVLGQGTPRQACDRLVQAALDAGGNDNVTVVVVDLAETSG